tara:strand:- start:512 stop:1246 length:735 start_codon:yes stop_codon:yes gene_type:complete
MIIDNHKEFQLDGTQFTNIHKELMKYFSDNGIDVEISDDLVGLKKHLMSQSKDDYPYGMDTFFDDEELATKGEFFGLIRQMKSFVLLLKKDDEIIATYAARQMPVEYFIDVCASKKEGVRRGTDVVKPEKLLGLKNSWYSSCQWTSKNHRGKKFGVFLDHLKKNILFDMMNEENNPVQLNYALQREALNDYHVKHLGYEASEYFMTYDNGIGGAGTADDKKYSIAYVMAETWKNKQDEIKKLYS